MNTELFSRKSAPSPAGPCSCTCRGGVDCSWWQMTKDTYKHMSRDMMVWILVFISLTSPGCEMFVIKETQQSYQTEEKTNVTFLWDTKSKTDLSLTNIKCFFQSVPRKVVYEMINGVELAETQHEQFAGRVQLDRDALREGRIRLRLSTVTAEDSGNYRCDLAFNYDENTRRWTFLDTEKFVLYMSRTTDEVSLNTPKSGAEIAEVFHHILSPRRFRATTAKSVQGVCFSGFIHTSATDNSRGSACKNILPRSSVERTGIKATPWLWMNMADIVGWLADLSCLTSYNLGSNRYKEEP